MIKQYLISVLILLSWHLTNGQGGGVRPDEFIELTNPTNENCEFYSQKNGQPRRISMNNVRKVMLPQVNPTPIAFFPTEDGNTSNLGQFVIDPNDALWYIDGLGNAINFLDAVVANVIDSVALSLIDSLIYEDDTLKLFAGDTVFKTEIISGSGGSGGILSWSITGDTARLVTTDTTFKIAKNTFNWWDHVNHELDWNNRIYVSDETLNPHFRAYSSNVNASPGINFMNGATGIVPYGDGFLVAIDGGSENALLLNFENTNMEFWTNNIQRMVITAAGNVGIGINTPIQKLDVAGIARIKQGTDNTFITGGNTTLTGTNNQALGYQAGASLTSGSNNTILGHQAGISISSGFENTAIGQAALGNVETGNHNVAVGNYAGYANQQSNNTFLGYEAGRLNQGTGSVMVGNQAGRTVTASNQLRIDNSSTTSALISGDFVQDTLTVNGDLHVTDKLKDSAGSAGTDNQVLTSTGTGTEWKDLEAVVAGADSVYTIGDSIICVIKPEGGTVCVYQDSSYQTADSICIIIDGVTTCFPQSMNSGPVRMSDLINSNKSNLVANFNYNQHWTWDNLASNTGLFLSGNGTLGGGIKKLLGLQMNGATSGLNRALDIELTCTGTQNIGILSYVDGGSINNAIYGTVLTGANNFAVTGDGGGGTGIRGKATTGGLAMLSEHTTSITNGVDVLLKLRKGTSGTPAAGLGGAIEFEDMATGPTYVTSNLLTSKWINANYATRTSQFVISGVRSGADGVYMTMSGDSITLDTTTFHINPVTNTVGINKKNPVKSLDVVGRMNLVDNASTTNAFINGGNATLSGSNNIGIGVSTLGALTTGSTNIALGITAGNNITTGTDNICIGNSVGSPLTTGIGNIMMGLLAGHDVTTGDSNVIIGYKAGNFPSTGNFDGNTMLGPGAGANSPGDNNVMLGRDSGPGSAVSNSLYIDITQSTTPLVKGDFANDSLRIFGISRATQLRDVILTDASSTNYTLTATSVNGLCLSASGAKTVTLPDATAALVGMWYEITNTSSSGDITVQITGGSGDTITGAVTLSPNDSAVWKCKSATLWTHN